MYIITNLKGKNLYPNDEFEFDEAHSFLENLLGVNYDEEIDNYKVVEME